jgi:hypothetical protein
MLLAFVIFAVFFAVRAALKVNSLYLIGTGICIGFALWTKLTAQLLYLVVPFAYIIKGPRQKALEKKRPLLRWIVSVVFSLLIGYGIFNLLRFSSSFHKMAELSQRHTKTLTQVLANPFNGLFNHMFPIVASLWLLMTFPLFILCLLGIIVGVLRKWRPAYFLLVWFLIVLIIEATVIKRDAGSRYWVVLLPPLILGAGYAVLELPALAVNKVRSIGESSIRKASIVAVSVMLAICVVAVAIPVVTCDAYSILRPDKYDRFSMSRWTWGWGYDELMGRIVAKSRNQKLLVFTGDGFSFLALKAYQYAGYRDDSNISIKHHKKANKLSDACKESDQVYFVVNQNTREKLPEGIFFDVKKYPESGNVIRDERDKSTDKRFNLTLTFARVKMPFLRSIEPAKGPPGTTITIRGGNFGTKIGAYPIKFGESPAPGFSLWTEETIITTVPSGLSGQVEVQVDTKVEAPDHIPFTVTP